MYYTYVLQSLVDGNFYVGYTEVEVEALSPEPCTLYLVPCTSSISTTIVPQTPP